MKSIAIVMVVYGHAARGLEVAGAISFDGAWGYADYLVYSVHMPVFFVASGFLFHRTVAKQAFWNDRLLTIAWPYLLWTTIFVSIQAAMSGSGAVNRAASLDRLLSIGWDPVSPFWFLYTLFVAFAISYLLQAIPVRIMMLLTLFLMLTVYLLDSSPGLLLLVCYGLFYFSVGRLLFAERTLEMSHPVWWTAAACIGFVIVSTIGYLLGIPVYIGIIGALSGIVAFVGLSKMLAETPAGRPLALLGRCSMGVFVMHIFVIAAVRFLGLKVLHAGPVVIVASCVLLAVILPLIAQVAANWLGVARLFGLKTRLDDILWRRQEIA